MMRSNNISPAIVTQLVGRVGQQMSDKFQIDILDDNFSCVVICAIRYCLGRKTYMPGLVCGYVKQLLPYLNDKAIGCMERDIREYKDDGMACDDATWMDMLETVRQQMSERKIKPWM